MKLYSIRTKLVILFSLLIGSISIFVYFYFPARQEKQAILALGDKAKSIAEMAVFSVSPALLFNDREDAEKALEGIKKVKNFAYLVVLDVSGNVFSAVNEDKANQANFSQVKSDIHLSREDTFYKTMLTIRHEDSEIGKLYLGLSLEDIRVEIEKSRATIALVSLLLFITGMAAIFGISTMLTGPLMKMVKTFKRITGGDLSHRAEVNSRDEVGSLANSFNLMVDNLENAHKELRSANIYLEKRVSERTKELQNEINERKRAENQIQASLKEKEVLLQEIHHRVKNNMQIISSLLNIQSRYISDEIALKVIGNCQDRVDSMALVHERLYQAKDLARVNFGEYARTLSSNLFSSLGVYSDAVTIKVKIADIYLGVDMAIPCGLVLTELISNSLKYAFPDGRKGEIEISLDSDGKKFTLVVKDNGKGFPADLDFQNTESLGLQLTNMLVEQLEGSIELDRTGGTTYKIIFPVHSQS